MLYQLVDFLQTVEQLLMIVAAHVVAVNEVVVEVVQLQVSLTHSTSTNNHPVWGNQAAGNTDAFHVYK